MIQLVPPETSEPHHRRNHKVVLLLLPAFIVLQIAFVIACSLAPTVSVPLGILLLVIAAIWIQIEPRVFCLAITYITFAVNSNTIGKEFIVKLFGFNWYAMDWILAFGFLAWLIRFSTGRLHGRTASSLNLPMTIFLCLLPVFAIVGMQLGNTASDALADLRLFFYYISFFLVLNFVVDSLDVEFVLWAMIICGIVGAVPEIINSVTTSRVDDLTGKMLLFARIKGAHEVNYPMQFVASMVYLPFVRTPGKKILLYLSTVISLVALSLSYTRGSWLAAFVGYIVTMVIILGGTIPLRKYLTTMLSALVLVSGVLLILSLLDLFTIQDLYRRATLVSTTQIDISSFQRVTEWQVVWNVFRDHPFMGAGLGHIFRFYVIGVGQVEQIYVHNSYLYVLSKMGIIGFAAFLSIFFVSTRLGIAAAKRTSDRHVLGLVAAFSSMIFVLLVKSLTTWHLNTLTNSLYVGLLLGVIGVLALIVQRSTQSTVS